MRDAIDENKVLEALKGVQDPELGQDLVDLGMVRDVVIDGPEIGLTLVLTTPACPLKARMEASIREALTTRLQGVEKVTVRFDARPRPATRTIEGVGSVILVGSGKGGVGKSTVATNLALAMNRAGKRVGLLDADIYGPNIPTMLGSRPAQLEFSGKRAVAPEALGIRFFSMGFLIEPDQAVVWRGPMLHSAIQQFVSDIDWGELDVLLVDLPPGTGDVQLSLAQTVTLSGAVVVSTPQDVALGDVRKGIAMFRQVGIPVLGLVENMATFCCPECGHETDIFLGGGVEKLAREICVPFLGSIPLDRRICAGGDSGRPIVADDPGSPLAGRFAQIAQRLAETGGKGCMARA